MDSIRNDEEHVAETLSWQLRASFELGVSGTMVFAWTDEWFTGGHLVEDWKFGIVSEVRKQKPAFKAVADLSPEAAASAGRRPVYLGGGVRLQCRLHAMDGCLASFAKVDYPHFEVIVVDDAPPTPPAKSPTATPRPRPMSTSSTSPTSACPPPAMSA